MTADVVPIASSVRTRQFASVRNFILGESYRIGIRSINYVVVVLFAVGVVVDYQPERFGYQTGVGVFERSVEVWRVVVASRFVNRVCDLHCRRLVVDLDAESAGSTVGVDVFDSYRTALDAEA